MQKALWDGYPPGMISDRVRYWVDLWEDIVDDIDDPFFSAPVATPTTLMRDLVDEIGENGLRSNQLRDLFYARLLAFAKDDAIRAKFAAELGLVQKHLKSAGPQYLGHLCSIAATALGDRAYALELCDQLRNVLVAPTPAKDADSRLAVLSTSLIVELLLIGHSAKTVREIPSVLFDQYEQRSGLVLTRYPHCVDPKPYECNGGGIDRAAYGHAVRTAIDALSVTDRLAELRSFAAAPAVDRRLVFQVRGLKGEERFSLGPVEFYSPATDPQAVRPGKPPDDLFGATGNDVVFMNAVTTVGGVDSDEQRDSAAARINAALDVLRAYYSPEADFQLNADEYVVVGDARTTGRAWSMPRRSATYLWLHGFDADVYRPGEGIEATVRTFLERFLWSDQDRWTATQRKIARALRFYRKAEEGSLLEDQILNYWVALESLFDFSDKGEKPLGLTPKRDTTVGLLMDVVPVIQGAQLAYSLGWRLYHYLANLLAPRIGSAPPLVLPEALVAACNLAPAPRSTIHLAPFIERLDEIAATAPPKVVLDRVLEAKAFYSQPKAACTRIEAAEGKIRDDLITIYRFRNRIVHRADFNHRVARFYVRRAGKHAGDILRRVIWEIASSTAADAADALVGAYSRAETLKERLRRGDPDAVRDPKL